MNDKKDKRINKLKQLPTVQLVSLAIGAAMVCFLSAMLFILINSSTTFLALKIFCTAVLCLLPAVVIKIYICIRRLRDKRICFGLFCLGLVLSLGFSLSYYISHDYYMSVYRYMKKTQADVYYYGGYESFKEDYADTADFIRQMKSAPASIILDGMSEEKLERLSADDLKKINSESLWDHLGYDDILGTDESEISKSMEKSRNMNAYDFTFKYRNLHAKTMPYMLTHPIVAAGELKTIITEGSLYSVSFVYVVMYYIAQTFAAWMVIKRFEVTQDGKIVYKIESKNSAL